MESTIVVMLFLHVFQDQGRETTNHMTEWAVTPVFIMLKLLTSKLQPKIPHKPYLNFKVECLHLPFQVFNNLTGHLWLVKTFSCQSDSECFLSSTFASCTHKPAREHNNLYPSPWQRFAAPPHTHTHSPTNLNVFTETVLLISIKAMDWKQLLFKEKIHQLNNHSFPQKKHLMVFMERLDSFWGLFPSRVFAVTFYALSIFVISSLSHVMCIGGKPIWFFRKQKLNFLQAQDFFLLKFQIQRCCLTVKQ